MTKIRFHLTIAVFLFYLTISPRYSVANEKIGHKPVTISQYDIYLPEDAEPTIKRSASDLQKYINLITGSQIPISNVKHKGNQIVVGDMAYIRLLDPDFDVNRIKPGGFEIKTFGSNLLIAGVDDDGTSNGIYTFLQKYMGCRYYAQDQIVVPHNPTFVIPAITDIQNPTFRIRMLWSHQSFSPEYCRWNRLTLPAQINPEWNTMWVHTTTRYVSVARYFSFHPDYFMLWDNKRIPNDIDYSNPAVLRLVVDSIARSIKTHPIFKYYSVSQPDGNPYGVCQCNSCTAIKDKYGSQSAVIINFVNQVAAQFPSKIITTLAYYYTRKPPVKLQIGPNVLVFVCNTDTNEVISSNITSGDNNFLNDLKGWDQLTKHIVVWEYSDNLVYPYSPFPNLYMLSNNLITYSKMGLEGVFEQCSTQPNSEFGQLRSYLLANLLWNPRLNIDSLMNDFLSAYYGPAAPYIKQYIQMMNTSLINSRGILSRVGDPNTDMKTFLTQSLVDQYKSIFNQAKNVVASDSKFLLRVDVAEQPLRFAELEIYNLSNKYHIKNGSSLTPMEHSQLLQEFTNKAQIYQQNAIMPGNTNPNEYMKMRKVIK